MKCPICEQEIIEVELGAKGKILAAECDECGWIYGKDKDDLNLHLPLDSVFPPEEIGAGQYCVRNRYNKKLKREVFPRL